MSQKVCSSYTVVQLKAMAKDKGHKGYSKMKKDELCKLLKIKGEATRAKGADKKESKKVDKPKKVSKPQKESKKVDKKVSKPKDEKNIQKVCSSYTVVQLKALARKGGYKGYSKMKKDELCKLLKIERLSKNDKKVKSKKVKAEEDVKTKKDDGEAENTSIKKSPPKKKDPSPQKVGISPKQKLDTLSEYFGSKLDKYYEFRGRYVLEWGWLLWLEKKLGNTMCVWNDNQDSTYGISYNEVKDKLTVLPWVIDEINRCSKKGVRFIVGVIQLVLRVGFHANAFIFDIKSGVLTRFEPHGAGTTAYNISKFDEEIEKWLRKDGKNIQHRDSTKEWVYHPPAKICPKVGPQARESWSLVKEAFKTQKVFGKDVKAESAGFCSAWSLLYIHFRIKNPDYTDKEVLDYILSLSDRELSYMIREYAEFIVKSVDPNWLTKKSKGNLKKGDYVKMKSQRTLDIQLYGKILEIKQKKALVWVVERKGAKKHKSGKMLIPINLLMNADDKKTYIDDLMAKQVLGVKN